MFVIVLIFVGWCLIIYISERYMICLIILKLLEVIGEIVVVFD